MTQCAARFSLKLFDWIVRANSTGNQPQQSTEGEVMHGLIATSEKDKGVENPDAVGSRVYAIEAILDEGTRKYLNRFSCLCRKSAIRTRKVTCSLGQFPLVIRRKCSHFYHEQLVEFESGACHRFAVNKPGFENCFRRVANHDDLRPMNQVRIYVRQSVNVRTEKSMTTRT